MDEKSRRGTGRWRIFVHELTGGCHDPADLKSILSHTVVSGDPPSQREEPLGATNDPLLYVALQEGAVRDFRFERRVGKNVQALGHRRLQTYPPRPDSSTCWIDILFSQRGSRPSSPVADSVPWEGYDNVLYPALSPVRTAPAGPDTAGRPPASAAGSDGGTQSRAAARQHRLEVASGG